MTPNPQHFRPQPLPQEIAEVRAVAREDARWVRPVFRPPPLRVQPVRPDWPYVDIQRTEPWAPLPRENALPR